MYKIYIYIDNEKINQTRTQLTESALSEFDLSLVFGPLLIPHSDFFMLERNSVVRVSLATNLFRPVHAANQVKQSNNFYMGFFSSIFFNLN